MYSDDNRFPCNPFCRGNFLSAFLSISLVFFLSGACSKESREEVQRPKVVVSIKKSGPEKPRPSVVKKTAADERKQQEAAKVKEGHYKVRKGDSLLNISARQDVYGDPMKWPSLYRLNMNGLSGMEITKGFPAVALPEGLELKFVTTAKASEELNKMGRDIWVVNVHSSETSEQIVPAAITLMKKGYCVYITTAEVGGKGWIRLRSGFYGKRQTADAAGKEIMSILEISDAWVAKIGETELEEYGGY